MNAHNECHSHFSVYFCQILLLKPLTNLLEVAVPVHRRRGHSPPPKKNPPFLKGSPSMYLRPRRGRFELVSSSARALAACNGAKMVTLARLKDPPRLNKGACKYQLNLKIQNRNLRPRGSWGGGCWGMIDGMGMKKLGQERTFYVSLSVCACGDRS